MSNDLFDQLAVKDVPPPPAQLERGVHQRLNRALLVQHLWDFALGALPCVIMRFLPAMVSVVLVTLTGRYPKPPDGNRL